jgi:hypothetical protein
LLLAVAVLLLKYPQVLLLTSEGFVQPAASQAIKQTASAVQAKIKNSSLKVMMKVRMWRKSKFIHFCV